MGSGSVGSAAAVASQDDHQELHNQQEQQEQARRGDLRQRYTFESRQLRAIDINRKVVSGAGGGGGGGKKQGTDDALVAALKKSEAMLQARVEEMAAEIRALSLSATKTQ
jgi:hypothetical protein